MALILDRSSFGPDRVDVLASNCFVMNAPVQPDYFHRPADEAQADLPLAAEGVLRHVWESRFGPMLIEVRGEQVFVNGQPVERLEPEAPERGTNG